MKIGIFLLSLLVLIFIMELSICQKSNDEGEHEHTHSASLNLDVPKTDIPSSDDIDSGKSSKSVTNMCVPLAHNRLQKISLNNEEFEITSTIEEEVHGWAVESSITYTPGVDIGVGTFGSIAASDGSTSYLYMKSSTARQHIKVKQVFQANKLNINNVGRSDYSSSHLDDILIVELTFKYKLQSTHPWTTPVEPTLGFSNVAYFGAYLYSPNDIQLGTFYVTTHEEPLDSMNGDWICSCSRVYVYRSKLPGLSQSNHYDLQIGFDVMSQGETTVLVDSLLLKYGYVLN